jgi:hypothetical protein
MGGDRREIPRGDAAMTAPTPAQTQQKHDPADNLVTDDMISIVVSAIRSKGCRVDVRAEERLAEALRAVAPMIAARSCDHINREATALKEMARELMDAGWEEAADYVMERSDAIAAAIRARGETP